MNATDTPRLRQGLQFMAGQEPGTVYIVDHFRIGGPIQVSRVAFDVIRLFDGEKSLAQLQAETAIMFGGPGADLDTLGNLVAGLDQEYFLETPRLHARLNIPDRPPACIGCYDADPDKAGRQLKKLFTAHGGPGLPGEPGCRLGTAGAVKAVLLPHMDYARGGVTYGWGLKELVERTDARLFVIVATSHYSGRRFTLTRQNFTSPFGRVETDQAYVDRLVSEYGDGLFGDPFAHVVEHSIELEVVGMQYAFEGKRDFRIVPLLVGSFFDCVGDRIRPSDKEDVAAMIGALRRATAAAGEPVCYVISGDLAHIGPKFDDEDLVSDDQLQASKDQDDAILAKAAEADPDGYFDVIAGENDARRICGLPPTYVALEAARPKRGTCCSTAGSSTRGLESVSFASMGFE